MVGPGRHHRSGQAKGHGSPSRMRPRRDPGPQGCWSPWASPQCPASCTNSAPRPPTKRSCPSSSTWSGTVPGCAAPWSWRLNSLPPTRSSQRLVPTWRAHGHAHSREQGEEPQRPCTPQPLPTSCTLCTDMLASFWLLVRLVLEYGSKRFQEPKYSDTQAEQLVVDVSYKWRWRCWSIA